MAKVSKKPLKIIVFCGGVGTRLWPMSRQNYPKQFQDLLGDFSMYQQTIHRLLKSFSPSDIYVSTGLEYVSFIKQQTPEIPESNIIAEPVRRDTLGAVGLANLVIYQQFPDATVAAIWGADHIVKEEKLFNHAVSAAAEYSQKHNKLVKIDVKPSFPSEHNGWVKIGDKLEQLNGFPVYEFKKFIEKPNHDKAKRLFRSRKYLINTGYLIWSAEFMHQLFRQHQPQAYQLLEAIRPTVATPKFASTLAQFYPQFEKVSVDYAIFEKLSSQDTVVIGVDLGWVDVGTWQLLYQGLAEDTRYDNITDGEVELINTKRSIVYQKNKNKIVSVIGLEDIVVVDTKDGLIVCDIHSTDKIKKLVDKLKSDSKLQEYV